MLGNFQYMFIKLYKINKITIGESKMIESKDIQDLIKKLEFEKDLCEENLEDEDLTPESEEYNRGFIDAIDLTLAELKT